VEDTLVNQLIVVDLEFGKELFDNRFLYLELDLEFGICHS
jgi:hypothetical protein